MEQHSQVFIREEDARNILQRLDQVLESQRVFDQSLTRIDDTLKVVIRRLDSHQKSLDLIDAERNILEDLIVISRSIQELLKQQRDHQQITNKDVRANLSEVKERAEQIPDEVKNMFEKKMDQLITVVEKKKVQFQNPKKSLLQKFKFW